MGKQIAPEEPMFAATPSAAGDSLDMELHGATATLDIDMSGMRAITTPDIDLTEKEADLTESSGLDFVFDEPGATSVDSQVAPTVETPMVRGESRTSSDTQEITVADLGLDVDALRELDALESEGDTVNEMSPALDDTVNERVSTAGDTVNQRGRQFDDTVEAPRPGPGEAAPPDDESDLLSATSLMNALDDSTMLVEAEPGMIDLSDATGEVSQLDATALTAGVDFDPGLEPPTMSEVGTKLDLARAYMDMGDPEGARSILDEVLQEGSATQKQEAERLIASLP